MIHTQNIFLLQPPVQQHALLEEYRNPGGWTITDGDKCELFCSNGMVIHIIVCLIFCAPFLEPKQFVSVYCEKSAWKGQPDLGFWCYDKPEKPGPQEPKSLDLTH